MNELKPEDVRKALAWYEVVGKNIGSVTIPYNELQAIAAQFREKDTAIANYIRQIAEMQAQIATQESELTALMKCKHIEADKNAEIERLQSEIKRYENTCGKLIVRDNGEVVGFIEGQEKTYINKDIARVLRTMAVDTARTNVITKFAEALKALQDPNNPWDTFQVSEEQITQIANSLKEELDETNDC